MNTTSCGFCRNVRLFFSLLKKHIKNFYKDYHAHKNICMISDQITVKNSKIFPPIVPDKIQKIREAAQRNFEMSKIDPEEKYSELPGYWKSKVK